ncbi:BMA_0021/BMA_0022 family TOMM bacteriocin [Polyangium spumosum]|nr:BMA_0021/BMA_0022 family TOMM bacteriocin [Polyangium spumosum]
MRRKPDLWALAAMALVLSSSASASDTEKLEAPEGGAATETDIEDVAVDDFSEVWIKAVVKAWDDETFKQALIADPAKALEEYFDYKLPRDIHLEIVDSQPGKPAPYKLALPAKPDLLPPGPDRRQRAPMKAAMVEMDMDMMREVPGFWVPC